jgi:hypothetical protein
MTSANRDIVLNGMLCDQFVASLESWGAYGNIDFSVMDPNNILWVNKFEGDFQTIDDLSAETMEEVDALEGQEQGNAFCRGEYDLNALSQLQEGYCCQAYAYYSNSRTIGILSSATSLTP